MSAVTVHVLAEDFKNNSYRNHKVNMSGCPLQRAFMRAGLVQEGISYTSFQRDNYKGIKKLIPDEDCTVQNMFRGNIPIKDFSFDIEVN